jgi:hypothetical protein
MHTLSKQRKPELVLAILIAITVLLGVFRYLSKTPEREADRVISSLRTVQLGKTPVEEVIRTVPGRPLEFHTLNGSIRVELPQRVHTSVSVQTQNGRVSSDFTFAQESKRSRTSLHGLIGPDEGRQIICESFNGNVHLARNS